MFNSTAHIALKMLCLMGLLMVSVACSVKGNIEDQTEITLSTHFGQQMGLVSGSSQNQTVNGYRVSATVGDQMTGVKQIVNGYTVIQSIQGSLSSESADTSYR